MSKRSSLFRKVAYTLLILLILIQAIRPARNNSANIGPNDIRNSGIPADVATVLERACFDCHSNNTHYPWYAEIQPIGWYLANHVREGKEELNFSEFLGYPAKKAAHKLEEVEETVSEGSMPLNSYIRMHPDVKLSEQEKAAIVNWARSVRTAYPAEHQD